MQVKKFATPKGTKDYCYQEAQLRRDIERKFRDIFRLWGYTEVITPSYEEGELLTLSSGQEISESLFYLFTPESINLFKSGEKDLKNLLKYALRFDGTVPVARIVANEGKKLAKPLKWFYIIPMWRYEEIRGTEAEEGLRLREFWQAGIELMGSSSTTADAEVIAIAIKALEKIGLKNIMVLVNSRGLVEGLLETLNVPKEKYDAVLRVIDKLAKKTEEELKQELKESGINPNILDSILEISKNIDKKSNEDVFDFLNTKLKAGKKALEELKEIFSKLKLFGVEKQAKFDLKIVRGLAYYTGCIFETFVTDAKVALGGGGRYDNMIRSYGGEPTPATGFGLGIERIIYALKKQCRFQEKMKVVDVFVIPVSKEEVKKSIEIAISLRNKNIKTDIDIMDRNLSKNISFADFLGARYCIIVGKKDLEKNEVTVKNIETGEERRVEIKNIVEEIK